MSYSICCHWQLFESPVNLVTHSHCSIHCTLNTNAIEKARDIIYADRNSAQQKSIKVGNCDALQLEAARRRASSFSLSILTIYTERWARCINFYNNNGVLPTTERGVRHGRPLRGLAYVRS